MFHEGSTILVSPFDGRQDICPNDPSSGRYMNVAKQDFRISVDNLVRGLHAFLTPSDQVLNDYFKQGEQDASRYLKKMNLYDSLSWNLYFSPYCPFNFKMNLLFLWFHAKQNWSIFICDLYWGQANIELQSDWLNLNLGQIDL